MRPTCKPVSGVETSVSDGIVSHELRESGGERNSQRLRNVSSTKLADRVTVVSRSWKEISPWILVQVQVLRLRENLIRNTYFRCKSMECVWAYFTTVRSFLVDYFPNCFLFVTNFLIENKGETAKLWHRDIKRKVEIGNWLNTPQVLTWTLPSAPMPWALHTKSARDDMLCFKQIGRTGM